MTEEEYLRRLASLSDEIDLAAEGSGQREAAFQRYQAAEFSLTIDFRLGETFPAQRREALVDIHLRSRTHLRTLKEGVLSRTIRSEHFASAMKAAQDRMLGEYRGLLTTTEMMKLFGDDLGASSPRLSPEDLA